MGEAGKTATRFYGEHQPLDGVVRIWPATGWYAIMVAVDEGGFRGRDSLEFEPLMGFVQTEDGTIDGLTWEFVEGPYLCIEESEREVRDGAGVIFVGFVHESQRDADWVEGEAGSTYEVYWNAVEAGDR